MCGRSSRMRRFDLTDEQWDQLKDLLPRERGRPGRPSRSNREMVNAMLWVLRTGAPWRDLPSSYGPWQRAWTRFSRWTRAGVWPSVLKVLAADVSGQGYLIDGTIVRAHQDAHGAKKTDRRPSGDRAVDPPQRFTLSWTNEDARFVSI